MIARDFEHHAGGRTPGRPAAKRNDRTSIQALQRAAGNANVAAVLQRLSQEEEQSPVRDLMRSTAGRPLEGPTRQFMESRLGADFSDVRIHTGARATEAARSVQAHAYTMGSDIVFQDGQYSPETASGQRMLAHELTHVVQQRSGPVDGTPGPDGLSISDPSDRFERAAEATADSVMSGGSLPAAEAGGAGLQRQEDEEELQASSLQRQEEEELEEEQTA